MTPPKYLTGNKDAINEFIDRFDVSTWYGLWEDH